MFRTHRNESAMPSQRHAAMRGPISHAESNLSRAHAHVSPSHPPSSLPSTLQASSLSPHTSFSVFNELQHHHQQQQQQYHPRNATELTSSDFSAHHTHRSLSTPGHQHEGFSSFFDDYASHHSFESKRSRNEA